MVKNMTKIQYIIMVLLVNFVVAVLFIKFSEVCSHYAEKSFNNIIDFLGLVVSVPLYWGMGLFVLFPILWIIIDQLPNSIIGILREPLILQLAGTILSAISMCVFRKKLNQTTKRGLILLMTTTLNMAALESFFISMGV